MLPAVSIKVALTCSPLVKAGLRAAVKLPSTIVPLITPFGVVMVTVAPSSPVTVTEVPSALISTTGSLGAVLSGAVSLPGADLLPATSVRMALTSSPLVRAGISAAVNLPSAPILPLITPVGVVIETAAPFSPLTVTELPSSLIVTTGALGGVVSVGSVGSGAVTLPGTDSLPALSINVMLRFSPSSCGVSNSTANLPSSSTTPFPIILPIGSLISMVAPGSPTPVTILPSSLITKSVGALGPVLSLASIIVGLLVLPALSVAVTTIVSPFIKRLSLISTV